MALVLYNPTNEEMRTQYVGEEVIIEGELVEYYDADGNKREPRCKVRVDDSRGRHVLNVLGPRGLVTLEYGDEGGGEEKKAEQGRERNHDFKYKQVIEFNTLNEQRYQSRLPYLQPSKHLKIYANELGIELRQPYAVADEAKKDMAAAMSKNQDLQHELKEKDAQLSEMRDQMAELTGQMKSLMAALGQKGQSEDVADEIAGKWATMGKKILESWTIKNWERIQMLPDADFKDLQDRFEKVYGRNMPMTIEEFKTADAAA